MIFVKEIILKQAVDIFLKFLEDDIVANINTPTKTYLATIIGEQKKIGNYDFLTQALTVFNKKKDDPRKIFVDYMYNMKSDKRPTIYVALAADSPGQNSMSMGEGYLGDNFTQIGGQNTPSDITDDTFNRTETYTRRFTSAINLVIISDNSNEVVLIYEIMRAGFISLLPHLSIIGFENLRLSGQDLILQQGEVPANTYKRVIQLSFEYMFSAIDLTQKPVIRDFIIELNKILDK
jgi:hypothetical protein